MPAIRREGGARRASVVRTSQALAGLGPVLLVVEPVQRHLELGEEVRAGQRRQRQAGPGMAQLLSQPLSPLLRLGRRLLRRSRRDSCGRLAAVPRHCRPPAGRAVYGFCASPPAARHYTRRWWRASPASAACAAGPSRRRTDPVAHHESTSPNQPTHHPRRRRPSNRRATSGCDRPPHGVAAPARLAAVAPRPPRHSCPRHLELRGSSRRRPVPHRAGLLAQDGSSCTSAIQPATIAMTQVLTPGRGARTAPGTAAARSGTQPGRVQPAMSC